MKRLRIPMCTLAILLAISGIVLAAPPQPGTFEIIGATDPQNVQFVTLPSGHTKFHLTSQGTVSGYFDGTFQFEEWGIVDLDYATFQGSGFGTNHGLMTVTTEAGQATIRFGGQTDSQQVWGNFNILRGTGEYADLHGEGTYDGTAGFVFTVNFAGSFHTAPN